MRDLYIKEVLRDLKNVCNLQESIKNLEEALFDIDQELVNVRAINYDGMPKGQGAKIHTRVEKLIIEKDSIQSKIDRTNKRVFTILHCIEQLPPLEQKIIEAMLIKQQHINTIVTELNVSKTEAYRIKEEALYKLSVKLFGVDAL